MRNPKRGGDHLDGARGTSNTCGLFGEKLITQFEITIPKAGTDDDEKVLNGEQLWDINLRCRRQLRC